MLRYVYSTAFGAAVLEGDAGVRFRLYAPGNANVAVVYEVAGAALEVAAREVEPGWFEAVASDARAGTRYRFRIGDALVPDPAARFAPEGPDAASEVIDPGAFDWTGDAAPARAWHEQVIYELHVGTFTPEGTYAAAAGKLAALAALGVTAIELMPLAEAPGSRGWGYDGVLLFAPSHNYGRPEDLKAFVRAAHAHGLAVLLDVVYNHFGPEGNYLHGYGRIFYTDEFHTPWGSAIAVNGAEHRDVRRFFIDNARYWLEEYRFDGLRLDAVHEIYDRPGREFLRQLAHDVRGGSDRPVVLILENERNEAALLNTYYNAQWDDDAHNALHVAVTGQTDGYYADYARAPVERFARTLTQGFAFQGEPSLNRGGEPRGEPSAHLELASFVAFLQNHDQVGNRPFGDRIAQVADADAVRAAAAILLLAPPVPMLFMGEEWAASTPFLYFCDFGPELGAKVTEGRRNEFKGFGAFGDPAARERIPDPCALATFRASVLDWSEREREPHRSWLAFYTTLLRLRREEIAPRIGGVRGTDAEYAMAGERAFRAQWRLSSGTLVLEANLAGAPLAGAFARAAGRTLFATHDLHDAPDGTWAPWSVRWSLA